MYFNAGLIPWFLNMQMLGLTNTFWAYIIPGIVAPYNIILVKTYIESIPAELEESAQIDGATHMLSLIHIFKSENQKKKIQQSTLTRNQLIEAARRGDEDAIESLTLEDMDTYKKNATC